MSQINETAIKTPGVYTTEIPSFPPSVAQVSTAVPAFIGYTEFATRNGTDLTRKAISLNSLVDYEALYGKGPQLSVSGVTLDQNNNVTSASINQGFFLYDSIRMFFLNGGGKCYIISIGNYLLGVNKTDFEKGLLTLSKEDEPTLILFPDAVNLPGATDLYYVQNLALQQCGKLQDRFTICDLAPSVDSPSWNNTVDTFRNNIDLANMSYAAAYTPYLNTNLSKTITYRELKGAIKKFGSTVEIKALVPLTDTKTLALIDYLDDSIKDADFINPLIPNNLMDTYSGLLQTFRAKAVAGSASGAKASFEALFNFIYNTADSLLDNLALNSPTKNLTENIGPVPPSPVTTTFVLNTIRNTISSFIAARLLTLNTYNQDLTKYTNAAKQLYLGRTWGATQWASAVGFNMWDKTLVPALPNDGFVYPFATGTNDPTRIANMNAVEPKVTAIMKDLNDALMAIKAAAVSIEAGFDKTLYDTLSIYRTINIQVASTATSLPPSGAMAGIYAQVDGTRGVWKAPANVSINGIQSLAYTIDNDDNDQLNVSDTGKSINALRFFLGKGNLVWGARTVDGNSNEWRYVSVRRFFIMVEESAKKATMPFVFEPNDANTWTKVRAMLENYLTLLWRQQALAGAKPEQAFYVKCGLGQTMTAQDVLNGTMIVEVGMAAVRPAEFIILRFSHLLQQS
ncbi:MAG: phage tail sheath C-terminal domain-containing protein [Bacteroidota bacterium]